MPPFEKDRPISLTPENEEQALQQCFLDDIRQNLTPAPGNSSRTAEVAKDAVLAQAQVNDSDRPTDPAEVRRRQLEEIQRGLKDVQREIEDALSRNPETHMDYLNQCMQAANKMRADRAPQSNIGTMDDIIWRHIDNHKDNLPRKFITDVEKYFRDHTSGQDNPNSSRADVLKTYLRTRTKS